MTGARESLVATAVRGGLWTTAGFALSQLLRLGGNIVLAALLFEEAFALAALASAVIQGMVMFSDFGVGASVVQNRRGDESAFLNTAWTIQVIRAVLLTLIAVALGQPLAAIYSANDPLAAELVWFVPLAAMAMLMAGFASPALLTAARHMRLAQTTFLELTSQIVGVTTMVVLAWKTGSVYALVVGGIAQAATSMVLSYVVFRVPRPRFMIERPALRDIFHIGKWLLLSTLLTFLALQLDKFAFAGAFSFQIVGIYAISSSLTALAPTFLGKLQLTVAFPLYSRVIGTNGDIGRVFEDFRNIALVLGAYVAAMIIGTSELFVSLAYDERYVLASEIIPPLMLGAWFAVLESAYGALYLAQGKAGLLVLANSTKVLVFVALFFVAFRNGNFMWAVYAVTAADFARALVAIAVGRMNGLRAGGVDALWTFYLLAVGVAGIALGRLLLERFELHAFGVLVIQCVFITLLFSWSLRKAALNLKALRAR